MTPRLQATRRRSSRRRSRPARPRPRPPPTARQESRARTSPTRKGRWRPRAASTRPTSAPSSGKQRFELLLVEDVQLQLLRLLELGAGARPRDHVVGLRADAAHGLAAERSLADGLRLLRLHAGGEQSRDQLGARTVKYAWTSWAMLGPTPSTRR